jgi:anti-sigma regulatory factor (Ser/Thr protein kinase)
VIRDDGAGFDPECVPNPCETQLDKVSGRGLLLMRTFMDSVQHNSQGNEVTLLKQRVSRRSIAAVAGP